MWKTLHSKKEEQKGVVGHFCKSKVPAAAATSFKRICQRWEPDQLLSIMCICTMCFAKSSPIWKLMIYETHCFTPNPLVFVYFALAATITASDGTHVHLPIRREREPYLRASTIYQVEFDKLYLYEIALISLVSRFWIRRKVLIAELLQIFIISSSIFLNVFIVNPFVKLQESNWTIAQEIWCSPAATAFASCWKSGRKKEGSF